MRRQPILHRRLTECRRASELPVSRRLLPLHALPRRVAVPRPGPAGIVPLLPTDQAGQFGVSPSRLMAAEHPCQHLLPPPPATLTQRSLAQCIVDQDCPPALTQQALTQLRKFAPCMRSHGVPNWPDPTTDSKGAPGFDITSKDGIDPYSPQTQSKINEYEHAEHPGIGVPLGR